MDVVAIASVVAAVGAVVAATPIVARWLSRPRVELRARLPKDGGGDPSRVTVPSRTFGLAFDLGVRNVGRRAAEHTGLNVWLPRSVDFRLLDPQGYELPGRPSTDTTDTLPDDTLPGDTPMHYFVRPVGHLGLGTHYPNLVLIHGTIPRGETALTIPMRLLVLSDDLPRRITTEPEAHGVQFDHELRVELVPG